MQIRNSKLCEANECRVYSTVNRPWWMGMLFHRRVLLWFGSAVCYNIMVLNFVLFAPYVRLHILVRFG